MAFLKKALALSLISWLTSAAVAFPSNIPCETVNNRPPGLPQGEPPQTSPSPYGIRVIQGHDKVRNGVILPYNRYVVEIYGLCNKWTPLIGFLLKAVNAHTGEIIGRFTKDFENYWQATHYVCRNSHFGAITHFIAYERSEPVQFQWILEDGPRDVEYKDVRFEATIVQNLKTYWTDVVWPEPKENLCRCPDHDEFKHSCQGYLQFGYCNSDAQVLDDLCPHTCNNCSSAINGKLPDVAKGQVNVIVNPPIENEGSTISTGSTGSSISSVSSSASSSSWSHSESTPTSSAISSQFPPSSTESSSSSSSSSSASFSSTEPSSTLSTTESTSPSSSSTFSSTESTSTSTSTSTESTSTSSSTQFSSPSSGASSSFSSQPSSSFESSSSSSSSPSSHLSSESSVGSSHSFQNPDNSHTPFQHPESSHGPFQSPDGSFNSNPSTDASSSSSISASTESSSTSESTTPTSASTESSSSSSSSSSSGSTDSSSASPASSSTNLSSHNPSNGPSFGSTGFPHSDFLSSSTDNSQSSKSFGINVIEDPFSHPKAVRSH